MTGSAVVPTYSAVVLSRKTGIKYDVTKALTQLRLSAQKNELAQMADATIVNVTVDGAYFTSLVEVGDRLFIYADDGRINEEVFRGFIWEKDYVSTSEKELTLTAYDNLIYMQKSEVCEFYSADTDTKTILNDLCWKWGVGIVYEYATISHPKLPLKGTLSDVIVKDILDEVKKQTGDKYAVLGIQDEMHIRHVGKNDTIYHFVSGENVFKIRNNDTLDDLVTKVVITGKTDDDDRTAIESVVEGDTDKYGTIQKLISKDEDTELSEAEQEAQDMLDEDGHPKKTIYIEAVDIPWIKKGDKIWIDAGDVAGKYAIVLSVEHDCMDKTISIEAELTETDAQSESDSSEKTQGKELSLSGVPLYVSSDATNQVRTVTGTYYLYDGIEINGRYRITTPASRCGERPINANVTGWIDGAYA